MEFSNAAFNLNYLNSYYHIKDDKLNFNNQSLLFSNFTLLDSLNNSAVLNGDLSYDPVHTVSFNLALQTNKFLAINSRANDTSQFYGKVILDSYAKITGNKDFPKVDVNAKMQKGSAFTFARRQDAVTNIESDGVVIFEVKKDTFFHFTTPRKKGNK